MNTFIKEFLKSDTQKFVPVHFLRTNYGFASQDADDISSIIELSTLETKELEVSVPIETSAVVMLIEVINDAGTGEEVNQVKTAPPGKNSVTLTLLEGKTYWVYVISKDHVDGYIGRDLIVSSINSETERLELSVESAEQAIDLSAEGRLIKTSDETDPTQWYNYQGYYAQGALIWEAPSIGGVGIGDYTYLIYYRDILNDIQAFFADAVFKPVDREFTNAVRVIDGHDQTVKYIDLVAASSFYMSFPVIRQLVDYMRVNLKEDFVTEGYEAHDVIEAGWMNHYYGAMWDNAYQDNKIFSSSLEDMGADSAQDNPDTWHPHDWYYDALHERAYYKNDPTPYFESANKIKSYLAGIARKAGSGTGERPSSDWNRGPGRPFEGMLVRRELASQAANNVKNKNEEHNERLDLMGLPQVRATGNGRDSLEERAIELKDLILENIFNYVQQELAETDTQISQVGDLVFIDGISGLTGETTFQVAHEATLQNIRFLKDKLQSIEDNIWTTVINSNALMFNTLQAIQTQLETENTKVNSLTNITSANIRARDVELLYSDNLSLEGNWQPLNAPLVNTSSTVKTLNLNIPAFDEPGDFAILIRPPTIEVLIPQAVEGDIILATRDDELLEDYQEKNAFYGWNIEFKSPEGIPLGEQRIITGSLWKIDGQYLQISPSIAGKLDFDDDVKATIWPNTFVPVLVNVRILEHNALSLSYGMYAKKEFNTMTGLCTIYDHNGNVYKQLTVGKRATDETGRDIIEYREPVE
jgi:hypothetical protein